jgi:hypothetical protein
MAAVTDEVVTGRFLEEFPRWQLTRALVLTRVVTCCTQSMIVYLAMLFYGVTKTLPKLTIKYDFYTHIRIVEEVYIRD